MKWNVGMLSRKSGMRQVAMLFVVLEKNEPRMSERSIKVGGRCVVLPRRRISRCFVT